MPNIENIEQCLVEIERRYNESEKARSKLKTFDDPIQFEFLDSGQKALLLINKDQGIETKNETGNEDAPVKLNFSEEQVLIDLLNGEMGGVKAYSSGQIEVVEGSIRKLIKLRKLMF
jgi:putative sterol carrier protein